MDQAQGLRDLAGMARRGESRINFLDGNPEYIPVGELANGGAFEMMGLPAVFDSKPEPDYRRLWLELKAELEREAIGPAENQSLRFKTIGGFGPRRAQAVLDRMEQSETFARVRHGIGVSHG